MRPQRQQKELSQSFFSVTLAFMAEEIFARVYFSMRSPRWILSYNPMCCDSLFPRNTWGRLLRIMSSTALLECQQRFHRIQRATKVPRAGTLYIEAYGTPCFGIPASVIPNTTILTTANISLGLLCTRNNALHTLSNFKIPINEFIFPILYLRNK